VTTSDAKGFHKEEGHDIKYRVGDVVQFMDPATGKPIEAMVIDIHNNEGQITVFSKEAVLLIDPKKCKRISKATDYEVRTL
jgi:ribosomal protein L35AE/L33A